MIQLIDYLRERPQLVRYLLFGIAFAVFIWSCTIDTSHAHTWMEKHIFGFWSLFAIGSCIILVYFARWYARAGISVEEDYYDN